VAQVDVKNRLFFLEIPQCLPESPRRNLPLKTTLTIFQPAHTLGARPDSVAGPLPGIFDSLIREPFPRSLVLRALPTDLL
jgi:hypothetical protein